MVLTGNGEKLLKYARTVTEAIDEAKAIFRIPHEVEEINVVRIGGVAAPLLLSGCYEMPNYRLKLKLIHNYETTNIVGNAAAVFMIADDKYMNTAIYKGVEKVFLYRQKLLLAVRKDSDLAERKDIHATELAGLTLIGTGADKGINDWVSDIAKENRCLIPEDLHCNYSFFQMEHEKIEWPFLMSSFGSGIASEQTWFKDRKLIPVKGKYTERDIYLWYDNRIKRLIQPYINLISGNAERQNQMDEKVLQ